MEKLSKDDLFSIALQLDLPELLNFCRSSKRINDLLCKRKEIWAAKLKQEFPKTFEELSKRGLDKWRQYYERAYKVSKGYYTSMKLYQSANLTPMLNLTDQKWANPSGLMPNDLNGFALKKDKNDSQVVYLFPNTYYNLFTGTKPEEGENHPTIMLKIEFDPKPKITEVPWNEEKLGETLFYRRGDGKVSWFNDLYELEFEFDGFWRIFGILRIFCIC